MLHDLDFLYDDLVNIQVNHSFSRSDPLIIMSNSHGLERSTLRATAAATLIILDAFARTNKDINDPVNNTLHKLSIANRAGVTSDDEMSVGSGNNNPNSVQKKNSVNVRSSATSSNGNIGKLRKSSAVDIGAGRELQKSLPPLIQESTENILPQGHIQGHDIQVIRGRKMAYKKGELLGQGAYAQVQYLPATQNYCCDNS